MTKYNLALIPEKGFGKKIQKISLELKKIKSIYVVGENSIPHCSVLQFYSGKKPENIWKDVPKNIEITLITKKYYVDSDFSKKNKTWFGIEIKKTKELKNLQKDLLKKMPYLKPYNKLGEDYFPHFTTGMILGKMLNYQIKDKSVLEKEVKCKLHLCKSGRHSVAEKILY